MTEREFKKIEARILCMDNIKDEDVFNTKKLDDIPESCREQLRIDGRRGNTNKILELFKIKKILSIDEIILGLYRLHGVERKRKYVTIAIYNLIQKKLIKKSVKGKRGIYEIIE